MKQRFQDPDGQWYEIDDEQIDDMQDPVCVPVKREYESLDDYDITPSDVNIINHDR
jgi:hypothetical protein